MLKTNIAVVGASGVVGRAVLTHCQKAGLSCLGLSRRPPDLVEDAGYAFVSLDLLDPQQCESVVKDRLSDVTHLVYTALYELLFMRNRDWSLVGGNRTRCRQIWIG